MEMLICRGRTRRMLAGLIAGCLLAGGALAAPGHTVTVSYSDLDLATAAGASALYARLKAAARFVCGEEGTTFLEQRIYRLCYRQSIADAAQAVHSPLLTRLVQGGKAEPPTAALVR